MFVQPPGPDLVLRGLLLGAIALGSLLAGAARSSDWSGFAQPLLGMVSLFALQWTINKARVRSSRFQGLVQNRPVVLMRGGEFRESAMQATRVSKGDILAKLRKANATDLSKLHAVVLETTGDVSVLYGKRIDERLLESID